MQEITPTPEVEAAGAELGYVPIVDGIKNPPFYRVGPHGEKIPITRAEYNKGMHDSFTVKHLRVPSCGHRFDMHLEPRHRNCEACWFAYFQIHGEMTQTVDEAHNTDPRIIVAARGSKFLKMFRRFMSTVATLKEQLETQPANA